MSQNDRTEAMTIRGLEPLPSSSNSSDPSSIMLEQMLTAIARMESCLEARIDARLEAQDPTHQERFRRRDLIRSRRREGCIGSASIQCSHRHPEGRRQGRNGWGMAIRRAASTLGCCRTLTQIWV
ncbi:hypothetical protein SASPL_148352 [Salvia splendens]|uniref:Uncharacterized protein n=1 Tax=Salvia splendens TaxID=180675 RepID=A0A8X8Z473_SALSN|nr:hypothetical protein SASPL_148352 [Salvia splendens]